MVKKWMVLLLALFSSTSLFSAAGRGMSVFARSAQGTPTVRSAKNMPALVRKISTPPLSSSKAAKGYSENENYPQSASTYKPPIYYPQTIQYGNSKSNGELSSMNPLGAPAEYYDDNPDNKEGTDPLQTESESSLGKFFKTLFGYEQKSVVGGGEAKKTPQENKPKGLNRLFEDHKQPGLYNQSLERGVANHLKKETEPSKGLLNILNDENKNPGIITSTSMKHHKKKNEESKKAQNKDANEHLADYTIPFGIFGDDDGYDFVPEVERPLATPHRPFIDESEPTALAVRQEAPVMSHQPQPAALVPVEKVPRELAITPNLPTSLAPFAEQNDKVTPYQPPVNDIAIPAAQPNSIAKRLDTPNAVTLSTPMESAPMAVAPAHATQQAIVPYQQQPKAIKLNNPDLLNRPHIVPETFQHPEGLWHIYRANPKAPLQKTLELGSPAKELIPFNQNTALAPVVNKTNRALIVKIDEATLAELLQNAMNAPTQYNRAQTTTAEITDKLADYFEQTTNQRSSAIVPYTDKETGLVPIKQKNKETGPTQRIIVNKKYLKKLLDKTLEADLFNPGGQKTPQEAAQALAPELEKMLQTFYTQQDNRRALLPATNQSKALVPYKDQPSELLITDNNPSAWERIKEFTTDRQDELKLNEVEPKALAMRDEAPVIPHQRPAADIVPFDNPAQELIPFNQNTALAPVVNETNRALIVKIDEATLAELLQNAMNTPTQYNRAQTTTAEIADKLADYFEQTTNQRSSAIVPYTDKETGLVPIKQKNKETGPTQRITVNRKDLKKLLDKILETNIFNPGGQKTPQEAAQALAPELEKMLQTFYTQQHNRRALLPATNQSKALVLHKDQPSKVLTTENNPSALERIKEFTTDRQDELVKLLGFAATGAASVHPKTRQAAKRIIQQLKNRRSILEQLPRKTLTDPIKPLNPLPVHPARQPAVRKSVGRDAKNNGTRLLEAEAAELKNIWFNNNNRTQKVRNLKEKIRLDKIPHIAPRRAVQPGQVAEISEIQQGNVKTLKNFFERLSGGIKQSNPRPTQVKKIPTNDTPHIFPKRRIQAGKGAKTSESQTGTSEPSKNFKKPIKKFTIKKFRNYWNNFKKRKKRTKKASEEIEQGNVTALTNLLERLSGGIKQSNPRPTQVKKIPTNDTPHIFPKRRIQAEKVAKTSESQTGTSEPSKNFKKPIKKFPMNKFRNYWNKVKKRKKRTKKASQPISEQNGRPSTGPRDIEQPSQGMWEQFRNFLSNPFSRGAERVVPDVAATRRAAQPTKFGRRFRDRKKVNPNVVPKRGGVGRPRVPLRGRVEEFKNGLNRPVNPDIATIGRPHVDTRRVAQPSKVGLRFGDRKKVKPNVVDKRGGVPCPRIPRIPLRRIEKPSRGRVGKLIQYFEELFGSKRRIAPYTPPRRVIKSPRVVPPVTPKERPLVTVTHNMSTNTDNTNTDNTNTDNTNTDNTNTDNTDTDNTDTVDILTDPMPRFPRPIHTDSSEETERGGDDENGSTVTPVDTGTEDEVASTPRSIKEEDIQKDTDSKNNNDQIKENADNNRQNHSIINNKQEQKPTMKNIAQTVPAAIPSSTFAPPIPPRNKSLGTRVGLPSSKTIGERFTGFTSPVGDIKSWLRKPKTPIVISSVTDRDEKRSTSSKFVPVDRPVNYQQQKRPLTRRNKISATDSDQSTSETITTQNTENWFTNLWETVKSIGHKVTNFIKAFIS